MIIIKSIIEVIISILKSSMLLILIAMILIFTRDYITDDDLKRLIEGISLALFEVFYLYQAYKDLKDNQYITYKYIVLSDDSVKYFV